MRAAIFGANGGIGPALSGYGCNKTDDAESSGKHFDWAGQEIPA